jgi:putative transposase
MICRTLGVGRATVYRAATPRARRYRQGEDRALIAQLRDVLHERASYGYRRVTALGNHTFGTSYNRKGARCVLELQGWTLPRCAPRRSGRAHTGRVARDGSNERWCSDSLHIAPVDRFAVTVSFVAQ